MTLLPNLLWQAPHTLSSPTKTLRFLPPFPPEFSWPSKRTAWYSPVSVFRNPMTMRPSLITDVAALIRPRKYDSRSLIGKDEGMRLSVEEAGRREPCFESRLRAGSQLGVCGGGGFRYRDRSVW